ncbi:MAG: hypothetical protein WC044_02165 [Crocinitomicaceae bacterium]
MKNRAIIIITSTLFLFACKESTKTTSEVNQEKEIEDSATFNTNRTIFLIDHCDDSNYSAVLEEDKTKGNDSCIIRINQVGKAIDKSEILNVPADRSSINYCEKDYVVVGFACGGPCYSQVFVFTDGREKKQFDYGQKVSNNPNLIAHLRNEEFEKLIIHNFKNGKELIIQNPDINWMQYGQMDTIYTTGNDLKLEYQTENKQTKKKSISLIDIIK